MDARTLFGIHEYPLICAPMATLSHRAYRELAEGFGGPSLYVTEMISAASLLAGSPYEESYMDAAPVPERLVYQLVGSDVTAMARAAAFLDGKGAFGIDLNMGCTAPMITRVHAGVAWMRSIDAARALVAAVRPGVRNGTLSVKLRLGWSEDPDYLVRFCAMLEGEGVDFITLHPRTAGEKFKRTSRWECVGLLQKELGIPVIANGDVSGVDDYLARKERYHPAGIMVGRFAARCPWAFALIRRAEAARAGTAPAALPVSGRPAASEPPAGAGAAGPGAISPAEAGETFTVDVEGTAYRFLDLLACHLPEDFHATRAQRFFFYYCDNFTFSHDVKCRIQNTDDLAVMRAALADYFAEMPSDRTKTYRTAAPGAVAPQEPAAALS